VYEFIVKFEISYFILQLYVNTFYLILYTPMMAVNVAKHVTVDTLYNICCVDGLFVGFLHDA
jgi:hypothetical protein